MIEKVAPVSYLCWPMGKHGMNRPGESEIHDQLDREAVAWLVRLTSGETTEEEVAEAQAWRARSPAHEQAFQGAERLWRGMEPLRGRVHALTDEEQAMSAWRTRWRWGAAAAVLALVTLALLHRTETFTIWLADHRTATGQQQTLHLADGTVAHLNTDTALSVHYDAGVRRVALLAGEADFVVAKDPSRPFLIDAGGGTIEAVGTDFVVRRNGRRVTVTMLEGTTRVSYTGKPQQGEAAIPLHAAQRVAYSPDSGLGPVEPADLRLEAAWRRGKLIFEETPLSTVLDEINRYRPGRVWALREDLTALPVSGVFDLNLLDEALTTIQRTLRLKAVSLGGRWVFLL
jgi:transmembrane sensor